MLEDTRNQPAADSEVQVAEDTARGLSAPAAASLAVLATALAACGGGDGDTAGGGGSGTSVLKPDTDAAAARFILQTSIGASTSKIDSVMRLGFEPWLDREMAVRGGSGISWLAAVGYSDVDINAWYDRSNPGDYMIWNQLMSGGGEVRKRAALALSEILVVSLDGVDFRWKSQGIARYWDILQDNAFGSFRTLLEDITLNPAMGVWLNTRGNRKADGNGRAPDENYAREVMQLFTFGLYQLNPDGTVRLDSGGNPIETYTTEDVQELAKVFTGFDFDYSQNVLRKRFDDPTKTVDSIEYTQLPMTADPSRWKYPRTTGYHSEEAKNFLGVSIPAGTGADASLKIALDTLAGHPNVGPFLARQLIQRLVTSNPSPDYVQRVAAKFDNNGRGERGDLGAVFKAVWLDPEALDTAQVSSATFGKIREPILRFAQWGRTFDARSTSGKWEVRDTKDAASALGQSPLRSPSVFNFFRPGYVAPNSNSASANLVAPELQIIDESTVPGYINFMSRTIEGSNWRTQDLETSYTDEVAIAHDATALLDRLDLLLTARQLSDTSRATILSALAGDGVTQTSPTESKLRRVHAAVMLVMAAPEYLVQS